MDGQSQMKSLAVHNKRKRSPRRFMLVILVVEYKQIQTNHKTHLLNINTDFFAFKSSRKYV